MGMARMATRISKLRVGFLQRAKVRSFSTEWFPEESSPDFWLGSSSTLSRFCLFHALSTVLLPSIRIAGYTAAAPRGGVNVQ